MLSCKDVASQMFLPRVSPEVLSGQEVNVCVNMLTLRLSQCTYLECLDSISEQPCPLSSKADHFVIHHYPTGR